MPSPIRYHPLFEADVLGAAAWYDGRNADLGSAFIAHVAQAVEHLIADPARRGTGDFGVRYWPVRGFPYVIFYAVTGEELLILGVMHTAREPGKWLADRL